MNTENRGLTPREEFLLRMYDQMFNDINRHILVVWRSIGLFVTAVSLVAVAKNGLLNYDIAISVFLICSFWFLSQIIDSTSWYNRNLVIIANIEKQFLVESDLKNIHVYFAAHREYEMISHQKIQFYFSIIISFVVVALHFYDRLRPLFCSDKCGLLLFLPYIVAFIGMIFLCWFWDSEKKSYNTFKSKSPGKIIDCGELKYDGIHAQPK